MGSKSMRQQGVKASGESVRSHRRRWVAAFLVGDAARGGFRGNPRQSKNALPGPEQK